MSFLLMKVIHLKICFFFDSIYKGTTYGRVYIRRLVASDSGTYKCVASNKDGVGGAGTSQLQVKSPFPPKLQPNKPPSEVTLYEGQVHEIECKADAYPIVNKYNWGMKSGDIDNMPNVLVRLLLLCRKNPVSYFQCIVVWLSRTFGGPEIKLQMRPPASEVSRTFFDHIIWLKMHFRAFPALKMLKIS